jgi:hypothetical protein
MRLPHSASFVRLVHTPADFIVQKGILDCARISVVLLFFWSCPELAAAAKRFTRDPEQNWFNRFLRVGIEH